MKVNPLIRLTLEEISKASVATANEPDKNYKHLRRFANLFKSHLTEEEQIFLIKLVLEQIHYRSVMVDPDNLLILSNIKLRTYMFIFVLSTAAMIIGAVLFKTNSTLNGFVEMMGRLIKLFSL